MKHGKLSRLRCARPTRLCCTEERWTTRAILVASQGAQRGQDKRAELPWPIRNAFTWHAQPMLMCHHAQRHACKAVADSMAQPLASDARLLWRHGGCGLSSRASSTSAGGPGFFRHASNEFSLSGIFRCATPPASLNAAFCRPDGPKQIAG
ncbi:hypothetical protein [Azohydromonas lata]|uniref:hypothetical protein n=1 Tax=Azohydromonas lata TaxID=45677 RepID=UPI0014718DD0|nr:hypothetical protein [Azohydromonas lata]